MLFIEENNSSSLRFLASSPRIVAEAESSFAFKSNSSFLAPEARMSIAGKILRSASERERTISILPVDLNSS